MFPAAFYAVKCSTPPSAVCREMQLEARVVISWRPVQYTCRLDSMQAQIKRASWVICRSTVCMFIFRNCLVPSRDCQFVTSLICLPTPLEQKSLDPQLRDSTLYWIGAMAADSTDASRWLWKWILLLTLCCCHGQEAANEGTRQMIPGISPRKPDSCVETIF